jgi:hypothetical protein
VTSGNDCRSGLLKGEREREREREREVAQVSLLKWNRSWWTLANSACCIMNVKMEFLNNSITGDEGGCIILRLRRRASQRRSITKDQQHWKNSRLHSLLAKSCLEFSGTLKALHIQNSRLWAQPWSMSGVKHWESWKNNFQRVCTHIEQPLLLDDSTKLHTSVKTTAKIQHLVFTVLHHPPYSPELVPSYFHRFPKMMEHPRAHHYDALMKSRQRLVVVPSSRCTSLLWWAY